VKLTIDKNVVDPNDIGMLQDLVIAAINGAVTKMRDTSKEKMASLMGGMSIPGMPGLF
jgi:nucleoid-associated protein EbfC